jgi:hypothetical protein
MGTTMNNELLAGERFGEELDLLLKLIRSEPVGGSDLGESGLADYIADRFERLDWSRFVELAGHHRLYPTAYLKLRQLKELQLPRYALQQLQADARSNTIHMLRLSAEMERVSGLLLNAGIRALVLKGPVLASDLYGDPALRPSGDLDILVPLDAVDRIGPLLATCGYMKGESGYRTILGDWKWRHHHASFLHGGKPVKLEIHWRLHPGPGREPGFDELWERRRESRSAAEPVYYLGREDLFLFLASHGARHGWSRLRWLADIDRICRQPLDEAKLLSLLKRYRGMHIAGQALLLAAGLLGTPLTPALRAIAAQKRAGRLAREALYYIRQMINLHKYPVPEDVSRYHERHLFALMPVNQKLLFVLSFLYPYPEDADVLTLPKPLHFLYFPLRPFLWAWRKTRKTDVQGGAR